ncbi:hypothetical protein [Polyangium mundeleinium]|uniref:Uncharacterized protein n=1 Tax=Polyangium mundeleinium TaxID=2995306 RepID=A0ABT5EMW7_9BACT|nr:hypothetical protein [Polyangium mundeleinium]MDC0743180.1 hypothetical protein [Polyangium mundeleinium]
MADEEEDEAATRVLTRPAASHDEDDNAPTAFFVRPAAPAPPVPATSIPVRPSWWRVLIDVLCFWRRRPVAAVLAATAPAPAPARPATSASTLHVLVSAPKAARRPAPTLVSHLSPGRRAVVDEVHTLLWSFEPHELEAAAKLIEHIAAARLAGPEGRVEAQIIYALLYMRSDEDGAVGLAVLRGKLLGLARSAVDQALLHLEEQGQVVLRPANPLSGTRQLAAGIEHPTRGLLERVALVARARRAS